MKIVINRCFGGFSLSKKVLALLPFFFSDGIADDSKEFRSSPALVELIEKYGENANGSMAKLKIVEIPTEATDFEISNYDGMEHVIFVLDGQIYHTV